LLVRPSVGRLRRAHAGAGMLAAVAPVDACLSRLTSQMVATGPRYGARDPPLCVAVPVGFPVVHAIPNGSFCAAPSRSSPGPFAPTRCPRLACISSGQKALAPGGSGYPWPGLCCRVQVAADRCSRARERQRAIAGAAAAAGGAAQRRPRSVNLSPGFMRPQSVSHLPRPDLTPSPGQGLNAASACGGTMTNTAGTYLGWVPPSTEMTWLVR
jgi:hypothetical protein